MHVKEANGLWKSQWKMIIKEIRPNYESELRESYRNLDALAPENTEKHDSFRPNTCVLICKRFVRKIPLWGHKHAADVIKKENIK